uniref:Uncharacterized protein n=1 Tax=Graphocephala atropunctata TaxID=36148 RepID=A0A1B6KYQ9_9HEMI
MWSMLVFCLFMILVLIQPGRADAYEEQLIIAEVKMNEFKGLLQSPTLSKTCKSTRNAQLNGFSSVVEECKSNRSQKCDDKVAVLPSQVQAVIDRFENCSVSRIEEQLLHQLIEPKLIVESEF